MRLFKHEIFCVTGHANLMLFVESIYRTQAVGSLIYPSSVLRSEYLVPGIAGTDVVGGKIKVALNFIYLAFKMFY